MIRSYPATRPMERCNLKAKGRPLAPLFMKEAPPQLEVTDMVDIKTLSKEELKTVPFDKWKMYCGVEGCKHFTTVRDYGLWPEIYRQFIDTDWINVLTHAFICFRHWKEYKSCRDKIPYKGLHIDHIKKTINCPSL